MALPLAKITIIIGAGVLGSVLAKEGSNLSASDLFSGAFKIAWKQIKRDDSPPSSGKPRNDALIAQVKELQKQLKDLVRNQPVTVYAGRRSGIQLFGGPVVGVVVVGLGCMWWKGWKLSDFMFATRRGLTDACSSVAKQLDQVFASVSDTKRHLSSRIDRVDVNLDNCVELTADTRDDALKLRGDMKVFSVDVESVHRAVQTLETKIGRIEEKQDYTTRGVRVLCEYVHKLENSKAPAAASIQASPSRPALAHSLSTPAASRTSSKVLALESPSPTESTRRVLHSSVSASGLKGISEDTMEKSEVVPNETTTPAKIERASSSRFGWKLPGLDTSFLTRTYSATMSFK